MSQLKYKSCYLPPHHLASTNGHMLWFLFRSFGGVTSVKTVSDSMLIYSSHTHSNQHRTTTISKTFPFLPSYKQIPFKSESNKMISARKLVKLARKWQKLAVINRKRMTWPRNTTDSRDASNCSTSSLVEKGHFVVYSADQRRFVLPLEYLKKDIVRELLKLAEEEFGITSSGPLTLPCDAAFLEYVISLVKRKLTKEVEEALIMSIVSCRCSSSSYLLMNI